jgi:hypothetical protein
VIIFFSRVLSAVHRSRFAGKADDSG